LGFECAKLARVVPEAAQGHWRGYTSNHAERHGRAIPVKMIDGKNAANNASGGKVRCTAPKDAGVSVSSPASAPATLGALGKTAESSSDVEESTLRQQSMGPTEQTRHSSGGVAAGEGVALNAANGDTTCAFAQNTSQFTTRIGVIKKTVAAGRKAREAFIARVFMHDGPLRRRV
jgi:hypothetical protein